MTAAWAALLVESTLKATLCLALAGVAALGLWRRSAAQRHLVWAVAIVAVLALPLLRLALPAWSIPLGPAWGWLSAPIEEAPSTAPPASEAVPPEPARGSGEGGDTAVAGEPRPGAAHAAASSQPRAGASTRGGAALPRTIVLVWSLGAVLALAPLALAFLRIAGIARQARPLDGPRWTALVERVAAAQRLAPGRFEVRRALQPMTPLTWGVLRPVVILPESCDAWSDEQAYEVLVHEAGHVRRHDCLTQVLASAACVLYWWNPLVWLAGRQLLTERERACDDQVLLAGARASDYANDLLHLARTFGAAWSTSQVTTAMARRSQIAGRLLAVLDPHLDRGAVGRRSILVGAAAGMLVVLPLASATPVVSGPVAVIAHGSRAGAPAAAQATLAAGEPAAASRAPLDLDRAAGELRERERAYSLALERADVEALAGFYTADAQVAAPSLPTAHGRRGARALLQHLVDAGVRRSEQRDEELYPVGELLCRVAAVRLASASGATIADTRSMTLWKKEDGTWRIHRDWAAR